MKWAQRCPSEPLLLKVFLLCNRAKLGSETYITHAPLEDTECLNCNGYNTVQKPGSLEPVPFDQTKWQDQKKITLPSLLSYALN